MMMFVENTNASGVNEPTGSGFEYEEFNAVKGIDDIIQKPTAVMGKLTNLLLDGLKMVGKAVLDLDSKSAALVRTLGVSSQRVPELTDTIKNAIPRFLELGMDAKQVTEDYTKLINKFNVNLSLSDDQLVELAATSKITGQAGEEMAKSFQDVGVPISLVGERMVEVAKIANEAGVTVGSVSTGVVKNLDKMNLYTFEGGVKGLAKMAAQASRLGIDMDKVFAVTEQVFNPEGAIDLAASLQRLGVASSELLDPLRLMDLAQNDPTELQNQIVNITKDFTRFNEQTKSFEILPGAKRRMNEVGKALGMTGGEFQKMALNAANFDAKLKQIKFSPDVKDEDRELVATMAQINEGGEAVIRIAQKDEKGEFTGKYESVLAKDITAGEIKILKEQQELQGKTAEEIAGDQLDQLKRLNGSVDRFLSSVAYGVGGSKQIQKMYKETMKGAKSFVETGKDVTPESIGDDLKKITEKAVTLFTAGWEIYQNSGIKVLLDEGSEYIKKLYNSLPDFNDVFGTSSTATATATQSNVSNTNRTLPQTTIGGGGNQTTSTNTQPSNMNVTHTFNFSNLPSYVTSTEVERILKEYTQNSQNALAMVTAAGKVNNGLTS